MGFGFVIEAKKKLRGNHDQKEAKAQKAFKHTFLVRGNVYKHKRVQTG
jgi:hypothetical protein